MQRRKFLQSLAATAAAAVACPLPAFGALPKMKITRIRAYNPPKSFLQINQIFNQSYNIVTIETDAGITGIGEGGSTDLLAPCASRLIGRDPQYIEHLWQDMNRGYSIPPAANEPMQLALATSRSGTSAARHSTPQYISSLAAQPATTSSATTLPA